MKRILGVLLDVDGTLIDSNDAHAQAWVKAIQEEGLSASLAAVRRLIGKGGDKLLPEVTGMEAESTQGKRISKRRGEIFQRDFLPSLRPFAGVKELLLDLKEAGLKLGVASSAKKEELEGLLRVCGANQLIQARATSDDADNSKPDPDLVHAALKQIGLPAEQVLLVGDTPYDVEAGNRAGVGVVALRCGGWQDHDLRDAVAIYDDPKDLLAHLESSPFGTLRNGSPAPKAVQQ